MDIAEFEARVAEARAALVQGYKEFLRARGLERLERHCGLIFQVDTRRRQHVLQVRCAERITSPEIDLSGPTPMWVDPETGERSVILCVTPRSLPVYQARSSFAAPRELQLDWTGDVDELRDALDAGTLAIDESWIE